MKTIKNVTIELPGTRRSIVMPAVRPSAADAADYALTTATGTLPNGRLVGSASAVATAFTAHTSGAREVKQASPPRGPSR